MFYIQRLFFSHRKMKTLNSRRRQFSAPPKQAKKLIMWSFYRTRKGLRKNIYRFVITGKYPEFNAFIFSFEGKWSELSSRTRFTKKKTGLLVALNICVQWMVQTSHFDWSTRVCDFWRTIDVMSRRKKKKQCIKQIDSIYQSVCSCLITHGGHQNVEEHA